MTEHILHDTKTCKTERCLVCEVDLALCTVCKGAECELSKECPGRMLTCDERNLICLGKLKFENGTWYKMIGAPAGGCWYCGFANDESDLVFCCEFDTAVHKKCVTKRRHSHPFDTECELIYDEVIDP